MKEASMRVQSSMFPLGEGTNLRRVARNGVSVMAESNHRYGVGGMGHHRRSTAPGCIIRSG